MRYIPVTKFLATFLL